MKSTIDKAKFREWYDSLPLALPHGHVAQMRMAWNAAMEAAAKVCDEESNYGDVGRMGGCETCADSIRALKETK